MVKQIVCVFFVVMSAAGFIGCKNEKDKPRDQKPQVSDKVRAEIKAEARKEIMAELRCGNATFNDKWKGGNQSKSGKNNIVAEYMFNGSADDSSGNPNHGTVIGAQLAADRFGKDNSAYSFSGEKNNEIDDVIIVKSDTIFNAKALTISVWVNGNSPKGYARIVDMLRYGAKEGYNLIFHERNGGNITFQFFDKEGNEVIAAKTMSKLKNGQWQHVAVTYDGKSAKIYYNGKLEEENNDVNKEIKPTDKYLSIGNGCDDTMYWPFKGMIDDVKMYDRALAETEIQALFAEK